MAAPEMKNHLSTEGSIGAAGVFSLAGIGGIWDGSTRWEECETVRFELQTCQSELGPDAAATKLTARSSWGPSCQ